MKIKCIFCKSSSNITLAGFRYNKSGTKQRYNCHTCKSLFVPNDGFWKMKNKPEVIAEAVSCRKRGMPFNEVSKHFKEYDKALEDYNKCIEINPKNGKSYNIRGVIKEIHFQDS